MQDQKIYNATITIDEVVDKGKKLSIKGHDGSRVSTYSVWKDKSDGTPTSAHAQYMNMGLGVGKSVYVGYVIDEYQTEIAGNLKTIQSKKIINFREPVGQVAKGDQSSNLGHSVRSQGPSGDAFGRRLAIHGFVNGMLANGATVETIVQDLPALLKLEDAIDKILSGPLNGPNLNSELPVIDQNEDLSSDVSGIPF